MTQLDEFLAKFDPDVEKVARAALAKMSKRLPGATQLVYDNYNALAIAFSPTEKRSDIILSIARGGLFVAAEPGVDVRS